MQDSPIFQPIYSIPYKASSENYYRRLGAFDHRVWLDSGRPHSDRGRFDILCAAPSRILEEPTQVELEALHLAYQQEWEPHAQASSDIPFCGGLIGYFNYDYRHQQFKIKTEHPATRPSMFASFDWALIQDHEQAISYLIFHPRCEDKSRIIDVVETDTLEQESLGFSVENLHADLSKSDYFAAIEKIHHHIVEGNCYQINFSQRFSGEFSGSVEAAYLYLRRYMPSPFSAIMELGDDAVMSFSPERFIQINDRHALTQPIKGTAARQIIKADDDALAQALLKSEKNRAENLMIVDLLRNDFSQSCEPFSVKVPHLFELQSFSNVHHLVSSVEGKIREGVSDLEFFLRCFPGGSITGAPKKRAMEIIDDLENVPRNVYCGSICYLSANGRLDSNIAIRTLLVNQERIFCWGGGGIVFDSKAEDEYQESLQKVSVLLDALKDDADK